MRGGLSVPQDAPCRQPPLLWSSQDQSYHPSFLVTVSPECFPVALLGRGLSSVWVGFSPGPESLIGMCGPSTVYRTGLNHVSLYASSSKKPGEVGSLCPQKPLLECLRFFSSPNVLSSAL